MFLMTTPPCLVPCPIHALSNYAENSGAGINRSTRFRPRSLVIIDRNRTGCHDDTNRLIENSKAAALTSDNRDPPDGVDSGSEMISQTDTPSLS